MNHDVIITCAVTGDDTKVTKSPHCAVTPEQIAATAIAAAKAGRRDRAHPRARPGDRRVQHGDAALPRGRQARSARARHDVHRQPDLRHGRLHRRSASTGSRTRRRRAATSCSQEDRMRHVIDLCHEGMYRPDIATLDCGSLNFGDGNRAYVSTPNYLRQGAAICKDLGVKPELEIFDTGNLWFVKQMIKEGLVDAAAADPAVHGHPLGRAGRRRPPAGDGQRAARRTAVWSSFAHQPHADALGRAVDAGRRQRPRRASRTTCT